MSAATKTEGSKFSLFANLPIKTKIFSGFLAIVVLSGAVGGVAYTSFESVGRSVGELRHATDIATVSLRVEAEVAQFRRYVREFALTGDPALLESAREWAAKIEHELEVEKGLVGDSELGTLLAQVEANVDAYEAGFETLAELKTERDRVVAEELAPTGEAMTQELKAVAQEAAAAGNTNAAILAQTALQNALELRLDVNKALGVHDEAAAALVEKMFLATEEAVQGVEKAAAGAPFAAVAATVAEQAKAYDEAYLRLAEVDARIDGLVNGEMKHAAEAMNEALEGLATAGTELGAKVADETTSSIASTETLMVGVAFGVVVAGLLIGWFLGGAIARPITTAVGWITRLAKGDDDFVVNASARKDEVGQLTKAVADLKVAVSASFRLGQMVDDMPINVMTCDIKDGFKIDYVNKTTKSNLKTLEKLLPIRAEDIIGTSIDVFHKNPDHQRRLLSNPANLPHKTNIRVGEEILDLNVAAIRDKRGEYIGPMLTWSIVTEQEIGRAHV